MVNWDLLNENWQTLGDWTKLGEGISEISPVGQLHQKPSGTYVQRQKLLAGGLPQQFTFEARAKIDVFGKVTSHKRWAFLNGNHQDWVEVYLDSIKSWNNSFSLVTEAEVWYIWRGVWDSDADGGNGTFRIYRNSVFIVEWGNLRLWEYNDGLIGTVDYTGIESHEDYFRIASGLHPPTFYGKSRSNHAKKIAKSSHTLLKAGATL